MARLGTVAATAPRPPPPRSTTSRSRASRGTSRASPAPSGCGRSLHPRARQVLADHEAYLRQAKTAPSSSLLCSQNQILQLCCGVPTAVDRNEKEPQCTHILAILDFNLQSSRGYGDC